MRASDYRTLPPRKSGMAFAALLIAGFLATFTVVFLWDGVGARPQAATGIEPAVTFGRCGAASRVACVVDGDTIWYHGTKIRVADIDAPEVSRPGCAREAALGEEATARLTALLNDGAFTLARAPGSPDTDRYGRSLREVHRGGESVGATLVAEGLAEEWGGPRIAWC